MQIESVCFDGDDLSVDELIALASRLDVEKIFRKGENFYRNELDKKVVSPVGRPFTTSTVYFNNGGMEFTDFLKYLKSISREFKRLNVEDVQIWMLREIEKNSQINGELSAEQIQLISDIGACYCWSVYEEDD